MADLWGESVCCRYGGGGTLVRGNLGLSERCNELIYGGCSIFACGEGQWRRGKGEMAGAG